MLNTLFYCSYGSSYRSRNRSTARSSNGLRTKKYFKHFILATSFTCFFAHSAQLAIVIDDVGYSTERDRKVFEFPVTVAIIPTAPHAQIRAEEAQVANREILLHLPMLPFNGKNLEPDTLTPEMSQQEINRIIKQSLDVVPMAVGINNHMGSAMTADLAGMRRVFRALEDSKLFFLDSLTTGKSQAKQAAAEFNRHILTRDVFLDDTISEAAINQQFDQALSVARKKGYAIVIGHPHQATINVLSRRLAHLPDDIQLTRLSSLLELPKQSTRAEPFSAEPMSSEPMSAETIPLYSMPVSNQEPASESAEINQSANLANENAQALEEQKVLIQQGERDVTQSQPKAESQTTDVQGIGNISHSSVSTLSVADPVVNLGADAALEQLESKAQETEIDETKIDFSKLKVAIPAFLKKVLLTSPQTESPTQNESSAQSEFPLQTESVSESETNPNP